MRVLEIESISHVGSILEDLFREGTSLGFMVIKAAVIFLAGRLLIGLLNKLVRRLLDKREIEPSVKSFMASAVNVVLIVLLIVSIIGALGIETTSFAALLASAGVAIGMALSGNLSNFAGGLIILIFKPFKVNDYIQAQGTEGTVKEIQIFHTILNTPDNKLTYIPNGSLSSGVVTNYNVESRRVEWIFSVDYGTDYGKVKNITEAILTADSRILSNPAPPFIALSALADSSVNVIVRVWVKTSDYWNIYYDINRVVYETYNAQGINFPFPQLTVHRGDTTH
ncbi:MAG: mechanosensitive ion channel [Tannerellaceae bacterium]|jgi:small conductance mechanosensitive channel|nr:mechanosensitive ion channel [Tannerellaceae bacterium]